MLAIISFLADHKTCFLPLLSYEIEIRNSLLGYKNQFTIVCGKEKTPLEPYINWFVLEIRSLKWLFL